MPGRLGSCCRISIALRAPRRRCGRHAIHRYPVPRTSSPKANAAGPPRWRRTYWGLAPQDYCEAADVWPLDPDGELLLMGIVENVRGITALPDILRQVKGIGAIWAGPGDLSVSMGMRGNSSHPAWRPGLPTSRHLQECGRALCDRHDTDRQCGHSAGTGLSHHHDAPDAVAQCGQAAQDA